MIVTAWSNGNPSSSGAGYGLKVTDGDVQKYFNRNWRTIKLILPQAKGAVTININKESFWNQTCQELISKEIGKWLLADGLAPWPKQKPPKFELTAIGKNIFSIVSPPPV
jgi:hypothetical protein